MIYEQFLPILEISLDYVNKRYQNTPANKRQKRKDTLIGGLVGSGIGGILGSGVGYVVGKRKSLESDDADERKKIIRNHTLAGAGMGAGIGGLAGALNNNSLSRAGIEYQATRRYCDHRVDREAKRGDKALEDISKLIEDGEAKIAKHRETLNKLKNNKS